VPEFKVTRAHLKTACDQQNWDLLDKLLEIDSSQINDNSLYTDTWGDWWGMVLETVRLGSVDGLRVLLKHGAERNLASWGDPGGSTPLEAARDKPEILALLQTVGVPAYIRHTDPPLPGRLPTTETAVNRQGEIREATGLAFQTNATDKTD
jgi:hypothetical protein